MNCNRVFAMRSFNWLRLLSVFCVGHLVTPSVAIGSSRSPKNLCVGVVSKAKDGW